MPKKRSLPGGLKAPGEFARGPWKAPNWAFVDQKILEAYSYRLHELGDLSLADIEVHFAKLGPTPSEPEWFVKAVRDTNDPKTKMLALKRMTG